MHVHSVSNVQEVERPRAPTSSGSQIFTDLFWTVLLWFLSPAARLDHQAVADGRDCPDVTHLHGSHCLLFGFCSVLVPPQLRDLHSRQLSVVDCVGAVRHSKTCLMAVNLIVSHLMAFLLSHFLSSMWGICLFQTRCGRAACRYFLVGNPQLIRKHNSYGYLKMMRFFTSSVAIRVHWRLLTVLFGLPIKHQLYL